MVVADYKDTAVAKIADGVTLYAASLAVTSSNKVLGVEVGASAGESKDFGFNGVVLVNAVENTTVAQIDNRATVVVGNKPVIQKDALGNSIDRGVSLLVEALDSTNLVNVAGSYASSQKLGMGASIAVNTLTQDTEALIGNARGVTDTLAGGSVTVGGNVLVHANTDGFIGAFAVAGAKAKAPDTAAAPTFSGAVAVGLAYNAFSGSTLAYIDSASISANGNISLQANFSPTVEAFSIGGSYASGKSTSLALSGAAAVNKVDSHVESYIQNSNGGRSVNATNGSVSLSATDHSGAYTQAGAVSIAWGSGNSTGGPLRFPWVRRSH